jgi:AcrR family transcriptional regulator
MPKVSAEHVEQRREQIVMATIVCFAKNGVQATTVQDICKEARLSAGAVYGYFKSKDALVAAVAEKGQALIRETLGSLKARQNPAAFLDDLILTFSGLFTGEHPFFRQAGRKITADTMRRLNGMLRAEALRNPKVLGILAKNYARLQVEVRALAAAAQAAGTARKDLPPAALAQALNSLFIGLEAQLAYDPKLDIAAYVKAARVLIAVD